MEKINKFSNSMKRLGTESAFRVLAKAQNLEAEGIDVVHMEIGEPDFDTPQNICCAATNAMANGQTHYCNSQGIIPLRVAIAEELEKTRNVTVDPDNIVVTPGAKPIMFYSLLALLNKGDEVIYTNPLFPIYESMINFTGAEAVPVPLHEEIDFRLDLNELESKITRRTKLIIINSPHNPTGGVLEKEDLYGIADLAKKHDIIILSDEVYEHIIYEGKHHSIASINNMLDRTILLSGFSKTFAMTGWRLGYAALPADLVEPIVNLIINSVSCTATFIQHAGIEALKGPRNSLPKMVNEFHTRRNLIIEGLNEIPGISCVKPKGAFYAFPNIKKFGMDSKRLADYLLSEAGVAALAGSDFGKYGEGYLRLSYATSQENILKALENIEKALAKLNY